MRKTAFLVVALLAVGALVGAHVVGAQETPPGTSLPQLCRDATYDINHDGLVSQSDIGAWRNLAIQCLDRERGSGFISPEACRSIVGDANFDLLDVDGDGDVDADDNSLMSDRIWACFPRFRNLGRGG